MTALTEVTKAIDILETDIFKVISEKESFEYKLLLKFRYESFTDC